MIRVNALFQTSKEVKATWGMGFLNYFALVK
jgi:hypothetical protein